MKKIWYLDAGHGGKDPGAVGHGLKEKDLTLDICLRVQSYMELNYPGQECRMSRWNDKNLTLAQRTTEANGWKAECFVSVHINAHGSTLAAGFESFRHNTLISSQTPAGRLQKLLHDKISPLWTMRKRPDRGMKTANFHVLRESRMPAVLLELGFISNPDDAALLKDSRFLDLHAAAIGDAVAQFLELKKAERRPISKPAATLYRVIVDGKQVGAFQEIENTMRHTLEAVVAGKTLTLEPVKGE
jgi:N-acetylmuramoyl-L-alanine amidase